MAKRKKYTAAPSGLTIERSGATFTCSWKTGQKYQKQEFQYSNGGWSWTPLTFDGSVTSYPLTWNIWRLYPYGPYISILYFRVRGKAKGCEWSGWAEAAYWVSPPYTPEVSVSHASDEIADFSWKTTADDSASQAFTAIEYQHMLTAESQSPNWNVAVTHDGATEKTIRVTENSSTISTGSHTRWFRARASGMAGDSAWATTRRVYATPHKAVVLDSNTTQDDAGINGWIQWQTTSSAAYPVDSTAVEYIVTVPAADVSLPSGQLSWTNAGGLITSSGKDAISFSVGGTLKNDECLFARVNAIHDNRTAYGTPVLMQIGYLADAENLSITDQDVSQLTVTVHATNKSAVEDSFLVITYKTDEESLDVGIIPHGEDDINIKCPDWTTSNAELGVRAVVGTYTFETRDDGVKVYNVTEKMASKNTLWEGGTLPVAPANVTVTSTDVAGSVRVGWEWTWQGAHSAIISWADHKDAWESTDEPSEYTISNLHASNWNIAGLEVGKKWYIRVRLVGGTSGAVTNGPWSPMETIDLSSAPATPSLVLSSSVVKEGDILTAYWSYVSTDGKAQSYAEICEATVNGGVVTYGNVIAHTETAQHIDIDPTAVGWNVGETHYLCVRVVSGAGKSSEGWSAPVPVTVAVPLDATISATSLIDKEYQSVDYEGNPITWTTPTLTEMPLKATVVGAGAGGNTTLTIERATEYHVDRPDETDFTGYEGEIIAIARQVGESEITIERDRLLGSLDDGAMYKMVATVKDELGQTAKAELNFIVNWAHQAVVPEATVQMLDNGVAKITPIKPTGWAEGDTCDIYRLSADRPELIVRGAEFGTAYVDPYSAIGEFGGHRIVYRTVDGDYITEENQIAWLDLDEENGDVFNSEESIIDFGGGQMLLRHNVDLSNQWEKDFRETKYLGGSVQGDWNAGVRRSGTATTTTINIIEQDTVRALRMLAVYEGICHIRTVDGSSYPCDIQVSENRESDKYNATASFSLSITRVDAQELEGMTYEQWLEMQEDELEQGV